MSDTANERSIDLFKKRNPQDGLNVFKKIEYKWLSPRGFYENIKNFFRKIKWAYQRIVRGYADIDLWNFDIYLSNLMYVALNDLANNSYGFPGTEPYDTPEKWKNFLTELADHFFYSQPENGSDEEQKQWNAYDEMNSWISRDYTEPDSNGFYVLKTDYKDEEKYEEAHSKWTHAVKEHSNFMTNHKDKAMDMLKEAYYNLWD